MLAYYNEIDPFAAAWLRNLIAAGHIAPGDVDERDIRDVRPTELMEYRQCHFFAGIAGWSYALRCAGWPDDRPVWTGSCPCQPFSAAGQGAGFADERHLWPALFHLLGQCRPPVFFGEQVANKAGLQWFDLVSTDLEGAGYTVGAADLCAAGVGAPHLRQRLWFVADAGCSLCQRRQDEQRPSCAGAAERQQEATDHQRSRSTGSMADAERDGCRGSRSGAIGTAPGRMQGANGERERLWVDVGSSGGASPLTLGDSSIPGLARPSRQSRDDGPQQSAPERAGSPVNGCWADAEWLPCRDGKLRAVKSGIEPLAHGIPRRVGRLRGYGNAIVPQVAEVFIRAYLDLEAQVTG